MWLRTRQHDRERWWRDQYREGYLSFVRTANRAMQEAINTQAGRTRGEEWVSGQRDKMMDLLRELIQKEVNVSVLGNTETSRLASIVRSAIQTSMDLAARSPDVPIEEGEETVASAYFRHSLNAFVAKVREDLGIVEDVPSKGQ
jgi:ABC-type xylose transport system substrate-binding protein